MDEIQKTRTIMFVGDYFTLMTTIVLDESLRNLDEDDDRDFAVRLGSEFIKNYYGFDVKKFAKDIGVIDEDGTEVDDDD
jgi:hypothetical protein